MDIEKFTERARGFIQSAQSLAVREGNQQFVPEHLLKVLIDDEEGLAARLINANRNEIRQVLRWEGEGGHASLGGDLASSVGAPDTKDTAVAVLEAPNVTIQGRYGVKRVKKTARRQEGRNKLSSSTV